MDNLRAQTPIPRNEPVSEFRPHAPETKKLKSELARLSGADVDIPIIIDGKEVRTGKTQVINPPHNHRHRLGQFHQAGAAEVKRAIDGTMKAWRDWSRTPASDRAAIFLKAADLLADKYRPLLNASTMLGQSKTCYQAEIDAACELVDFYRFNVHFQQQLYAIQPESARGMWNRLEYRPLEGFVFAVTPFNFTSIGGNLPTAPALMGNVAIWKPASTSVYSNYFVYKLLEEAGLPPGVIQFLPGSGATVGDPVLKDPNLGGIHFTGSTGVFQQMWKHIGENITSYRSYPRIVGETGGKDFVFVHASADVDAVCAALLRGAFEYQGQKCSAASRAYIPKSLWPGLKERIAANWGDLRMGDISDFKNFLGAVIDRKSFDKLRGYIEDAKKSSDAKVVFGGTTNDETGYFIEPTIIETSNPKYRTMVDELFGPVLTVYIYDDAKVADALTLCDETSPYALTGAVFSQDRAFVTLATERLTHSAGNFYINNKPTGAVVGQQPFGGARGSGTNDKAGSLYNLMRWVSLRTLSETFCPPTDFKYPFMLNEG